jgi:DNA-binding MarR family transcriptional regulator
MHSPKSLQTNILFLCGQISKQVHEHLTRSFKDHGYQITVEQFSILAYLWYEEGSNQQHLAEVLERDKTTIARVITNMEKKNLLVRRSDPDDQRNKRIYLTEKGKELQDALVGLSGKVYGSALHGLDEGELSAAISLLQKIYNNLTQ